MQAKRIGIMGGTFDPIHFGHLVTAEHAREAFNLDEVIFMPAGLPVMKKDRGVSNKEDRFNMVKLAIEPNPYFKVSRMELDRPGDTYTYDTLKELKDVLPKDTQLYFITGADAIIDVLTWKNARGIGKYASFIAATRPGYDIEEAQRSFEHINFPVEISYLEIPALAISSSYMRERIKHGESIRYLTDAKVVTYIHNHALYVAKTSDEVLK